MKKTLTSMVLIILLAPSVIFGQEAVSPEVSLHMAVLTGDTDAVGRHIEAGSDLNERDAYGSTPLIVAITFGRTGIARDLLQAGADPGIRDSYGSTPLHLAALFCRTEIVAALLAYGADRYARSNDGSTPYDIVAVPFDVDRDLYDELSRGLGRLGLKLDYDRIAKTRPVIAGMLRTRPEELDSVGYMPMSGNGWEVSTPGEQGLDPALVAELYFEAERVEKLFALLVVKNGCLIAEEYFNGMSVERRFRIQSVTKSVTSALVGIALDQGSLSSLNQRMMDFFPEIAGTVTDPRKMEITVRHLLQMRAGYPWEETDPALWKGLLSGIYPPLIEDFPLIADPGAAFNYSNLSSNWLGIILSRACSTNLKPYAEEHLFSKIGVSAGEWGTDAEGHNNGCGDLHLTARDMARFGLLYLNGGEYGGKRVLPEAWVRDSLKSYSNDAWVTKEKPGRAGRYFRDLGYGYQWWSARVGGRGFDFAWGHGGQLIVLLDDMDMIVVAVSEPFYLQHDEESWRHEQATINLVGKFIRSLPGG